MFIKLGDTQRIAFGTYTSARVAVNADSTPVVVVIDQGTAMAYTPTVTNKATGLYEVALVCSTGNGFTEGHEYSVYQTNVISSVTVRDGIGSFTVRSAPDVNVASLSTLVKTDVFGIFELPFAGSGTNTRTQIYLGTGASTVDGFYAGAILQVVGTSSVGGWAVVDSYVGSTKVATLVGTGLPTAPGASPVGSLLLIRAPDQLTSDAVRLILDGPASVLEGSYTTGDMIRLAMSVLAGPVGDFRTGLLIFKSLDGSKTRLTTTTDASGRISQVIGDLTP